MVRQFCELFGLKYATNEPVLSSKEEVLHDVKSYFWDDPLLFNHCNNSKMRPRTRSARYPSPYRGYFGTIRTATKVLQSDSYWPTLFQDYFEFVKTCDRCQRVGNILRHHELPLTNIMDVKIFYIWGIDFMGPFPPSFGQVYIL